MDEKQIREELESLGRTWEEAASTPEKALAFLKEVGLLDENGDLAAPYRADREEERRTRALIATREHNEPLIFKGEEVEQLDEIFLAGAIKDRPETAGEKLLAFAIGLWVMDAVSLGKAAQIAQTPKEELRRYLSRQGIPTVRYSPEELDEDMKTLEKHLDE